MFVYYWRAKLLRKKDDNKVNTTVGPPLLPSNLYTRPLLWQISGGSGPLVPPSGSALAPTRLDRVCMWCEMEISDLSIFMHSCRALFQALDGITAPTRGPVSFTDLAVLITVFLSFVYEREVTKVSAPFRTWHIAVWVRLAERTFGVLMNSMATTRYQPPLFKHCRWSFFSQYVSSSPILPSGSIHYNSFSRFFFICERKILREEFSSQFKHKCIRFT